MSVCGQSVIHVDSAFYPRWTVKWISAFELLSRNKWRWCIAAYRRISGSSRWLNPKVGDYWRCSAFITWTWWTLAMATPWWQHHKHTSALVLLLLLSLSIKTHHSWYHQYCLWIQRIKRFLKWYALYKFTFYLHACHVTANNLAQFFSSVTIIQICFTAPCVGPEAVGEGERNVCKEPQTKGKLSSVRFKIAKETTHENAR